MFRFFAPIVLLLALASNARADALAEALDAHQRGDEKAAVAMLIPLAEAGDVTAMNTLSHIYWWGEGVRPDHAEALKWTRLSAARGSSAGQNDLAVHYKSGDGVPKDPAVAGELMRMAADQGAAISQMSLGAMYLTGKGMPVDREAGINLIRTAALQGYYKAQRLLGILSWQGGYGVPRDVLEAVRFFELAAEQRDVESQVMLAFLYVDDVAGTTNLPRAVTWLTVAASAGCIHAAGMAAALLDDLPADQYRAAADEAAEWENAHPVDRHRHDGLPDICFIGPREGA